MAYNENIPQPTDQKRVSQNDILQNFTAIKSAFDVNHVTFDLGDEGKHNYVSLPEQVAGPATAANELAVYAKQSALTGVAELFVRKESSGDEIEFTSATAAVDGWTRLPSGILIKWGSTTSTGNDTLVLPVGATIPAFTSMFTVQLTVTNVAVTDIDQAIRATSFTLPGTVRVYASNRSTTGPAAVTYDYLIIGV